jgi:hypothetical protein
MSFHHPSKSVMLVTAASTARGLNARVVGSIAAIVSVVVLAEAASLHSRPV